MFDELKKEYDNKYNEELNKTGLFWAFNRKQFDENKTHKNAPDSEYLTIGDGGYIHKSNKNNLDNFFKIIAPKLNKDFTSKIKIDDLIEYELENHECYYTGDFSLVIVAVKDYYNELSNKEIIEKVKSIYDKNVSKIVEEYDEEKINI